jgi:hypothetical protein
MRSITSSSFPKSEHDAFFAQTFQVHPNGNANLFGLNTFGCDSIIKYKNQIWKFYAFQTGTDNAIYLNKFNETFILNCIQKDPNVIENITRMCITDITGS